MWRSQWPRGLRRMSAAARLLRLWVRIPPGACMFVCCECFVLSGRGLCDELITRPEESYRLWCVVVCDLETSRMRRPWSALGRSATGNKTKQNKTIKTVVLTDTINIIIHIQAHRDASIQMKTILLTETPVIFHRSLFPALRASDLESVTLWTIHTYWVPCRNVPAPTPTALLQERHKQQQRQSETDTTITF